MYYAYIIQNSKGLLYKGSTDNIEKRIRQHNEDDFPRYTKGRGPWECVYKEIFKTRREAKAKEKFFKTGKGREFIRRKLKEKDKAE